MNTRRRQSTWTKTVSSGQLRIPLGHPAVVWKAKVLRTEGLAKELISQSAECNSIPIFGIVPLQLAQRFLHFGNNAQEITGGYFFLLEET